MAVWVEGVVAVGGRRVGYALSGDPGGRPVVFCHGGPGSRHLALGSPEQQADAGVLLVTIERPGFGLSDLRPGWTLRDWPDVVDAVVDHLGLDRYAVVGVSAGSRCALACGALRPDQLTMVGVIAGVLPPAWYPDDELVALAAQDVDAARREIRAYLEDFVRDLEATVAAMGQRAGPDGAVYRRPEVRDGFLATYREAFRSGLDGAVQDVLLGNLPWQFDLADVSVPVRWWHGDEDVLTPVSSVRAALDGLLGFTLTVLPSEGHAIGITHAPSILTEITEHW